MTEPKMAVLAEMTIAELLERWPETAVVFYRHHMACVGCVVAPFYTVADAADVYGLSLEMFVAELTAVMETAVYSEEEAE